VFTHVEELANKMVRPESYSLCVERRKAEKTQDLKEVIKRLKKENDDLSALLTEAWRELDVLKASNKDMSARLEAIKAALR
jgi:septal ring factor EnvC (AmiA/AmiB activator)